MQQGILKSVPVKRGQQSTIQAAGKFFKIMAVIPSPVPITVTADGGSATEIGPGQGLPISFNSLSLSCAYNREDVTVLIFIGDAPLMDLHTNPEDWALPTLDYFTIAAGGNASFLGQITINGINFRRLKATFYNVTGTTFGNAFAATVGVISTKFALGVPATTTNGSTFTNGSGFDGPGLPLMPGTATQIGNPITIVGEDTITVNGTGQNLDVCMICEWVPILNL